MTVLIAIHAGSPVGYVGLLPSVETSHASAGLYVSDLYVDERYRGRGVGQRLMAAAASHARMLGGRHLWLTMMPQNNAADRFYRRLADIREPVIAFAVTGQTFDELAEAGGDGIG
ncbi:GNAT family N-acetyltransferase [Oricola cellulosilytica]|uniref:GNAT family N-acetyltransferase n=1 Tax=Oricola cellulosilytica TaxID=1429082 RepID=A0A4R0PBS0_9HYPH|nr:GNAT family N-acetyltransferase [Oricola cellulosilytica]TCD13491.1 GNAT family N-acetyltransferase [Oricola cellulosilytica]